MYSIALYLPMAVMEDGPILKGWSVYTVMLSFLGSAGGLLVAFTMKYTDAVLKTFATSGAIIVCTIAGYFLMNAPLDIPIMIGSVCTVLSLYNYSDNGDPMKADAGKKSAAAFLLFPFLVVTFDYDIPLSWGETVASRDRSHGRCMPCILISRIRSELPHSLDDGQIFSAYCSWRAS